MFKPSLTACPENNFCKWSTDPELDPVLNKAIEIWYAKLSQLQQPQIHQIQQPAEQQQQQQIPVPEDLNSDNDSDSDSGWDDSMDAVFGFKRNITLQIPHGVTRGPKICKRSNFNRDQQVKI